MLKNYVCLARKYRPRSFGPLADPSEREEFARRVEQVLGGPGVDISRADAVAHVAVEWGIPPYLAAQALRCS